MDEMFGCDLITLSFCCRKFKYITISIKFERCFCDTGKSLNRIVTDYFFVQKMKVCKLSSLFFGGEKTPNVSNIFYMFLFYMKIQYFQIQCNIKWYMTYKVKKIELKIKLCW